MEWKEEEAKKKKVANSSSSSIYKPVHPSIHSSIHPSLQPGEYTNFIDPMCQLWQFDLAYVEELSRDGDAIWLSSSYKKKLFILCRVRCHVAGLVAR